MLISCLTVTQSGRLEELARSVRCFARQTHPERELVVVHDGADAFDRDLRSLLEHFPTERIHIERAAPGTSLGALRNLSLRHARGGLVCQWDDDDLYHPGRLAAQYGRLVETGADFCFLTDQLHWFQNTGEFFWDDWNVEPWPMNLIQGTLLGRHALMPAYPDLGRGEDTPVLQALFESGAKLTGLGGRGCLYIYTYSGNNAWDLAHHAAISKWKRLRRGPLEARYDELAHHLRDYELPIARARFPHDEGELIVALGDPGSRSADLSVQEPPGQ
ncbi:MAG: glycosyltransferase family A protein [Gammaproteobacteria bacterium]|nr:glycosyltransferase family A protein [Gammaproteobacteria bacterium]